MGKLKRARQKYHASITKDEDASSQIAEKESADVLSESSMPAPLPVSVSDNLFAGLQISTEDLKQTLPDYDKKSVKWVRFSTNEKPVCKKEKMKLRREQFLKKINAIHQMEKEQKEKRKRQKTVITGDMRPLADALPSLEELMKKQSSQSESRQKSQKSRQGCLTMKQKEKNMMQDIITLQQVWADPDYKSNPLETITAFIHNKIRQGIMEET